MNGKIKIVQIDYTLLRITLQYKYMTGNFLTVRECLNTQNFKLKIRSRF